MPDVQKKGEVFEITKDSPKVKPDVTINLTDETFQKLVRSNTKLAASLLICPNRQADGSLNGQKAFMWVQAVHSILTTEANLCALLGPGP